MTRDCGASITYQELIDFFNGRHEQLQKFLLWQVKCRETAAELAQETYVRFLRHSDKQSVANLNAFLFTIAANLARDHLRSARHGRAMQSEPLDDELPDPTPSVEDVVESQCLEERLERAIHSLPERTREVFLLYRLDGLSYREIGELLGLSTRTVEYHLRQAMVLCRRHLTNSGKTEQ